MTTIPSEDFLEEKKDDFELLDLKKKMNKLGNLKEEDEKLIKSGYL